MHKYALIFFSCALALVSCSSHEFDTLDATIAHSDLYEKKFISKADSLKMELNYSFTDDARWEKAYELSNHYKRYNIDSTGKYISVMEKYCPVDSEKKMTTDLFVIWNLIHLGRHAEAVDYFESLVLPDDASPELVRMYYKIGYNCYSQNYGEASISADYPAKYAQNAYEFWQRDSTSAASVDVHARFIRRTGNVREAIRLLEGIPREAMTPFEYAQIEHHIASSYLQLGDEENYRRHMILSACEDIRNSTKIYVSLNYLAKTMLDEDDPKRASLYVDKALRDAIQCNYLLGVKRAADLGLSVNEELASMQTKKRVMLTSFLLFFIVFSIVISFLLYRIHILIFRIKFSNEDLEHKSALLEDASRIRDGFLASSLEQAAKYIGKVDEERKNLRKTLKVGGVEALSAFLRQPSYSDSEHLNFNAEFDKTFTGIFPKFVEEVNALMKPDKKFEVPDDGTLTTELRILALIRLGIDESQRIAGILFISKGTVYTYRCNMRMASICAPEEFEGVVKTLG